MRDGLGQSESRKAEELLEASGGSARLCTENSLTISNLLYEGANETKNRFLHVVAPLPSCLLLVNLDTYDGLYVDARRCLLGVANAFDQ